MYANVHLISHARVWGGMQRNPSAAMDVRDDRDEGAAKTGKIPSVDLRYARWRLSPAGPPSITRRRLPAAPARPVSWPRRGGVEHEDERSREEVQEFHFLLMPGTRKPHKSAR